MRLPGALRCATANTICTVKSVGVPFRACSHYPQGFNDECKVNECQEDEIQCFKSGEDSAEAFEPSEEPFDFISLLVEFFVVAPGIESVGLGRDHWNHA